MDSVLLIVKRITFFILGASLLTRLFGDTKYRKYMEYATGLIVIALVAGPVLSFLRGGETFQEWFRKSVFKQQSEEAGKEIQYLGEKWSENILEKYKETIREDVAELCGTKKKNCQVKMEDGRIVEIRAEVPGLGDKASELAKNLAVRYGIDESCVILIE